MSADDIPMIMQAEGDMSEEFKDYLHTQLINQEDKKECTALVAVSNEIVLGHVFVYYSCRWGAYKNQGMPSIVDLKVFPPYRNLGVATKLLDEAERIAAKYHSQIYLDVCLNADYGAAQRLYVKRGYVPDGKGVYYEETICPLNGQCINNDELTICLIKQL